MSIQNIPEIINAVGGDRRKRITLIIILIAIILMGVIAKWTARGDCDPLIQQNEQLLSIQKTLTEQNQSIIEKNRELTEGYLQIQDMLTRIKPDTVYIRETRTIESPRLSYVESHYIPGDTIVFASAKISVPKDTVIKNVRKTSHGSIALKQIQDFVSEKCDN